MIRWQSHWHVVRQSWTFFQNDFAGRIANRVMQTGPALRESVVGGDQRGLVHPGVSAAAAIGLLAAADWRLAVPIVGVVRRLCLPAAGVRAAPARRARARCRSCAPRSPGRVVDSYTNILTVKLFARARDEDAFVRDAVDDHTAAFRAADCGWRRCGRLHAVR